MSQATRSSTNQSWALSKTVLDHCLDPSESLLRLRDPAGDFLDVIDGFRAVAGSKVTSQDRRLRKQVRVMVVTQKRHV